MAYQYSVAVRNAALNGWVAAIGPSPVLSVFSGAEPADCATSDPPGLLCTIPLPATWMNAAAGGSVSMAGLWGPVNGSANGTIASWRIYDSFGTCHIQGNASDMTFNNLNVAVGQPVSVIQFTVTAGNA